MISGAGVVLSSSGTVFPSPSKAPTVKPTGPSFPPTMMPTTTDTITVDVELVMVATAAATTADQTTIKSTVVTTLGVASSTIKNFALTTESSSRRRLTGASSSGWFSGGRLLETASYTWTITFDVVISLSALTDDSVTDVSTYVTSVSTSLSSADFLTSLQTAGLVRRKSNDVLCTYT